MEVKPDKKQHGSPLIVDMDGTLIKTDMLYESANGFIVSHPLSLVYLLSWLWKGKSFLKSQLAQAFPIDATVLPYNTSIISFLKEQKSLGRTLVLATASHRSLAEAVANHVGLFDEVLATEGENNLKAEAKRDSLINRFGEKGFDYIGNSSTDLPVWKSADKAYVVSASPKLIAKASLSNDVVEIISPERPSLSKTLFKALRVHQWVKNLLLFLPPLAAHQFVNINHTIHLIFAFVVFCLTASSVYVLNDLIDIPNDRHHHRKRLRPFAAGNLSLLTGWILWPALLITACLITGLTLSMSFFSVLVAYFMLTIAYSLRLKQIAIVDVMTLAILYTIRIIAGAKAIEIPLSFWLLALSLFIFLSLAFIKRYSELYMARESGRTVQIKGRGYVHQDLGIISSMGVGAGYLAVLVLALYVQDPHTIELYQHHKYIWLACPLLLYWISRVWILAARGQMHEDPVIFAIKDPISWLVGACLLGIFLFAMTY